MSVTTSTTSNVCTSTRAEHGAFISGSFMGWQKSCLRNCKLGLKVGNLSSFSFQYYNFLSKIKLATREDEEFMADKREIFRRNTFTRRACQSDTDFHPVPGTNVARDVINPPAFRLDCQEMFLSSFPVHGKKLQ